MTNNLENVKPGDALLVREHHREYLAKVERTTATQVIAGNTRYRKSDGQKIGGDRWSAAAAYAVTEDEIAGFRRRVAEQKERLKLSEKIMAIRLGSLSLGQLRRIVEIAEEANG